MAGLGTLVEARVVPAQGAAALAGCPDGFESAWCYVGPGGPLTVAQDDSLRATWVGGAGADGLLVPWGPIDSINDAGAYRRLADGLRSVVEATATVLLVVRLMGTSVRTSGRWLEIRVVGGPRYELRQRFVRGATLTRDGEVVAKGFRGEKLEVASAATPLDATIVAAYKATLWRMLLLPKLPDFEIPGD